MSIYSSTSNSDFSDPLYDSREDHFIPESEIEEKIRELKNQNNLTYSNQISGSEVEPKKFTITFLSKTMRMTKEEWYKMINGYGDSDDLGYDSITDHFIPETQILEVISRQEKAESERAKRSFEGAAVLDSSSEHFISESEIEKAIYNKSEHFFSESELQEAIDPKKRGNQKEEKFDPARAGEFNTSKQKNKNQGRSAREKEFKPSNDIFSVLEKLEKEIEIREALNMDKGRSVWTKRSKFIKFPIFTIRKCNKRLKLKKIGNFRDRLCENSGS
jgi:hypothetical protein